MNQISLMFYFTGARMHLCDISPLEVLELELSRRTFEKGADNYDMVQVKSFWSQSLLKLRNLGKPKEILLVLVQYQIKPEKSVVDIQTNTHKMFHF